MRSLRLTHSCILNERKEACEGLAILLQQYTYSILNTTLCVCVCVCVCVLL